MTSGGARVSAPGKLMVAGEYAVLEGHPCVVAAVSRRARATLGSPAGDDRSPAPAPLPPESARLPPEALLARSLAEEATGPAPGELVIDVSALRQDGKKLGLGSSAAAAACAAGAVYAWHGHALAEERTREAVLGAAMAGHREVAPEGSHADVAASVLGGFLRYRREGDRFEASHIAWPSSVHLRAVWTGREARTSDLVREVRALAARDRRAHGRALREVAEATLAFLGAVAAHDGPSLLRAVAEHARALARLGEEAGAPIIEARIGQVVALAAAHGGAAKPSGAGGGDVALAFFTDGAATHAFEEACTRAGFSLLSLAFGAEGLSSEGWTP